MDRDRAPGTRGASQPHSRKVAETASPAEGPELLLGTAAALLLANAFGVTAAGRDGSVRVPHKCPHPTDGARPPSCCLDTLLEQPLPGVGSSLSLHDQPLGCPRAFALLCCFRFLKFHTLKCQTGISWPSGGGWHVLMSVLSTITQGLAIPPLLSP